MVDSDQESLDLDDLLLKAWQLATLSKDPSTQLGAILFREDDVSHYLGHYLVRGVNHLPSGIDPKVWKIREQKYKHVIHAEIAVIEMATRCDYPTVGATLVCPWACCMNCARKIAAAGIAVMVVDDGAMRRTPTRWAQTIIDAHEYLKGCGVDILSLPTPENKPPTLFDGSMW